MENSKTTKMTKEEILYPRQFTSIIEENTNFYSHTGDGGNMCFASNCDTIEKVWIEPNYIGEDVDGVCISVTSMNDIDEALKIMKEEGIEAYVEYLKPAFEVVVTSVEDIISAFNTIENKFK